MKSAAVQVFGAKVIQHVTEIEIQISARLKIFSFFTFSLSLSSLHLHLLDFNRSPHSVFLSTVIFCLSLVYSIHRCTSLPS